MVRPRPSVRLSLALLTVAALVTLQARAADPPRLRVLTYNIHHGEALDGKFDYERLARVITDLDPDIVALQEVDRRTRRASGVDQAELLGRLTGMHAAFGNALYFSGGEYGEALLSRVPLREVKAHPLPFRPGLESRTALAARVRPERGLPELLIVGTHLCHQSPEIRREQTEQLRRLFTAGASPPVILAGDFNARSGSEEMRTLLDRGWRDASDPRSRIDYVLVRDADPWKVAEVRLVDERVVSDHRPLLVVLEWQGDAPESQPDASPREPAAPPPPTPPTPPTPSPPPTRDAPH